MGAAQSKQPPSQPSPPITPATFDAATPPAAVANVTVSTSTTDSSPLQPPSSPSSASGAEGGGGGGGCPMKNPDGSYRIVPGFASLFGRMGGGRHHPPVDPSKINAASPAVAVDVSDNGVSSPAEAANNIDSTAKSSSGGGGGGGCPVKHDGASFRSWNVLRRGGPGPGSDGLSENENNTNRNDDKNDNARIQYDVYSRPLPMDPANNMPVVDPATAARNSLPAPTQSVALSTERASSTIPKAVAGDKVETWTYPSPQMFYNALARKGKLDDDTSEDDMESVVAIHNCMNEGTWGRILQWERVLDPASSASGDGEDGGGFDGTYGKKKKKEENDAEKENAVVAAAAVGPSLTKFMGRPSDLSPKAAFKHYVLGHPLPFDRHDWTVTRTRPDGTTSDVRYVIDYYHDDAAAREEEGSGLPRMDEGIGHGGRVQSLLVDVRPAADGLDEIWGRMFKMPLARRGCRSALECVLFKGRGSGRRVEFDPLPLVPSESLKQSVGESRQVWENIQKDAMMKKGVGPQDGGAGEACASDSLEEGRKVAGDSQRDEVKVTNSEAAKLATVYSDILSECREPKAALQACTSDEECSNAFMQMTVCAGKHMCPLQHRSLVASLEGLESAENQEMAEAKMTMAYQVLGECVTNFDGKASAARKQFPDVFDEAIGKKGK